MEIRQATAADYERVRHFYYEIIAAEPADVLVIHALGVHPSVMRRGLAKEMVRYVLRLARERHLKAVRLDILGTNLPAEKSYTACGFVHRATLDMYYPDTGRTEYKVFECIL